MRDFEPSQVEDIGLAYHYYSYTTYYVDDAIDWFWFLFILLVCIPLYCYLKKRGQAQQAAREAEARAHDSSDDDHYKKTAGVTSVNYYNGQAIPQGQPAGMAYPMQPQQVYQQPMMM